MKKRIVICADGTWNRPEKNLSNDFPTNVLRFARSIKSIGKDLETKEPVSQQIFYDWGVGSDSNPLMGGITGKGLNKNIMDDYRYLVQNYTPGDEIFLFGFSRGSYTIRSLCGFINNCGILKRAHASCIEDAFEHYKKPSKAYSPSGSKSVAFRKAYSHPSREVAFVGAWDTVGAMGIPISFLGLFEDKDEFYDTKIGSNVRAARHAMAIDEYRRDFEPTIWMPKESMDMKQVWFTGAHSNIGGSYKPDRDGSLLSDNALEWMMREASGYGLAFEPHLKKSILKNPLATLHNSRRSFYRLRKKFLRLIDHGKGPTLIHQSVKERWDKDPKYRPANLAEFVETKGWDDYVVE